MIQLVTLEGIYFCTGMQGVDNGARFLIYDRSFMGKWLCRPSLFNNLLVGLRKSISKLLCELAFTTYALDNCLVCTCKTL